MLRHGAEAERAKKYTTFVKNNITMKERYISPLTEPLELRLEEGVLQALSGGQFGGDQEAGSPLTEDPIIIF